ncbi:phospholipid scramblase 1-like [Coregonus clupeaformis]|uniref:phospholipid scramblase 1-like n=1 Tax=Coregonus clupeaformis TaxID=59861 RepID=UPI001BE123E0|nr:phospholipid scramblase 1-like [Coregonus clupeaformis]
MATQGLGLIGTGLGKVIMTEAMTLVPHGHNVNFDVKSLDETVVVGQISKQWVGFLWESFTDADNFGISFPVDLDVKVKVVMLVACFLIDFMYFKRSRGDGSHSHPYG